MATACNTVTRRVLRFAKLLLLGLLLGSGLARAEVRFDVFMGFSNKARSNEWFPATFEIENDGPTFEGVIEIKPDFSDSQTIRYTVELPTNTRKRLTIPVFNHSGALSHVWVEQIPSLTLKWRDHPFDRYQQRSQPMYRPMSRPQPRSLSRGL